MNFLLKLLTETIKKPATDNVTSYFELHNTDQ
jgi:hypothetical protein